MADLPAAKYPRQYVPAHADMGDWARIEPCFAELERRPIETAGQLEQWLLDQSELAACIEEESTRRHAAMTCHTDDAKIEADYLFFVANILPKCEPRWQALRERYAGSPARGALPKSRYFVYDRNTLSAVELFREENVPLRVKERKLDQQYRKTCGAMTVVFDGREQTLQQMARYEQETDRTIRQQSWERVGERRLQDRDAIDGLFDHLIALRSRMGTNAGFASFRDYQFRVRGRFDYGPPECEAFHRAVEKVVVPVARTLQRTRRDLLGVEPLRPWDLRVDPAGRPPLRPFATASELCVKCADAFHRLDETLGAQFDAMVRAGWMDLDSRRGKAPGGYLAMFEEHRRPFIFMNAVGLHRDVETLLHESGHAFHSLACRDEPLIWYRDYPIEMAEVASMGMELLALDALDAFYGPADLARARRTQFEGIISQFPWVATIDAFQHWLYTHPAHSRTERTALWLTLLDRFGGIEDFSGYEQARASMWQRQMHLFSDPFYYIEYGIAQIGALQLWQNARQDRSQALKQYRAALALGGSRPLPELWATAGLRFDFSEAALRPLISAVQAELDKLPIPTDG